MPAPTARPATSGPRSRIPGTAYLVCIEAPGLHVTGDRYARHYLGWHEGVADSRTTLTFARNGSPLLQAAEAAGLALSLARSWPDREREFCERLRRRSETPQLCPDCSGDHAYRRGK